MLTLHHCAADAVTERTAGEKRLAAALSALGYFQPEVADRMRIGLLVDIYVFAGAHSDESLLAACDAWLDRLRPSVRGTTSEEAPL